MTILVDDMLDIGSILLDDTLFGKYLIFVYSLCISTLEIVDDN